MTGASFIGINLSPKLIEKKIASLRVVNLTKKNEQIVKITFLDNLYLVKTQS
ncbi:MAG: hypothetical protein KatS3mg093_456 [Candidatus Parcubacteria bacterium]|nr:MAG: hypothetical protein KatS3mg093_456 [Candidatus Parcubacteria bacterium]